MRRAVLLQASESGTGTASWCTYRQLAASVLNGSLMPLTPSTAQAQGVTQRPGVHATSPSHPHSTMLAWPTCCSGGLGVVGRQVRGYNITIQSSTAQSSVEMMSFPDQILQLVLIGQVLNQVCRYSREYVSSVSGHLRFERGNPDLHMGRFTL